MPIVDPRWDLLDRHWLAVRWASVAMWAVGLGCCTVLWASPVTPDEFRQVLLGSIVVAAGLSTHASIKMRSYGIRGAKALCGLSYLMTFFFGPFGLIYALGGLPIMSLQAKIRWSQRDKTKSLHSWCESVVENPLTIFANPFIEIVVALGFSSLCGTSVWFDIIMNYLKDLNAEQTNLFEGLQDTFRSMAFGLVFIEMGILVGLTYLLNWWWGQVFSSIEIVDDADQERRSLLANRFTTFLHDDVLTITERAAAGQPLSQTDRLRLSQLNQAIRRDLMGDTTPRTMVLFLNNLAARCSEHGVVPDIRTFVEANPSPRTLQAFAHAADAILSNIHHAEVTSVVITVIATSDVFELVIRDHGKGFDAASYIKNDSWSPETKRRVFEGLLDLEPPARVEVFSELSEGTTWELNWERQEWQ